MSKDVQDELLKLLEEENLYRETHQLDYYKPYPKQLEFHNARQRERLFMAGNQLGKTMAGSNEVAIHTTGRYDHHPWWDGHRFKTPVIWWAAGESGESTRNSLQKLLFGEPGQLGTGSIPKECIIDVKMSRGVADLIDYAVIQHTPSKGKRLDKSFLYLKSYGQGREKWQAATIHGVWFDEEPDLDVYSEGVTRTNKYAGPVIVTFTPLKGKSDVVMRYMSPDERDQGAKDRVIIRMGINDVPDAPIGHYSAERKIQLINSYPEHERDARAFGEPFLGSGRVFDIPEEQIRCAPFQIPKHYRRLVGLDFGWGDHPTAAAWVAHDPDTDTVYVYDGYRSKELGIHTHASAIRARARETGDIRIAWPQDGLQKDKSSGIQVAQLYRNEHLDMIHEWAQYPDDRGNGLEGSISDLYQRFKTGRLKIFSTVGYFFEEYRDFHRKDGVVVKVRDDFLSALRYAVMMLRFAEGFKEREPRRDRYATDKDRNTSWMAM